VWPEGAVAAAGWRLIDLPTVIDDRGSVTFADSARDLPFEVKRVYQLYDVPPDAIRAGHAHRSCAQCLIAASGSFRVSLDDGLVRDQLRLATRGQALYVPAAVWLSLDHFSAGAVCLVLASRHYDQADYWLDYEEFIAARRQA